MNAGSCRFTVARSLQSAPSEKQCSVARVRFELKGAVAKVASGTCAENCWYAKEMDCRCQCNGANHGVLLAAGIEIPARTKREASKVFKLVSVHSSYVDASNASSHFSWGGEQYNFNRDRDAKVQTVYASKCKWPEVQPFFGKPNHWGEQAAYIVWGWNKNASLVQ